MRILEASYDDLPLPLSAFSPREHKGLNFLLLAAITAVVVWVVVDTFMSQQPFEEKILIIILGCGFVGVTFALVLFLGKLEKREPKISWS